MPSTVHAFFEHPVHEYFAAHGKRVVERVERVPADEILQADAAELANRIAAEFTIRPLVVDFDNPHARPSQQMVDDMSPFPGIFPSRAGKVQKQVITYRLPYTGDAGLLRYRPSTYSLASVDCYVDGDRICI